MNEPRPPTSSTPVSHIPSGRGVAPPTPDVDVCTPALLVQRTLSPILTSMVAGTIEKSSRSTSITMGAPVVVVVGAAVVVVVVVDVVVDVVDDVVVTGASVVLVVVVVSLVVAIEVGGGDDVGPAVVVRGGASATFGLSEVEAVVVAGAAMGAVVVGASVVADAEQEAAMRASAVRTGRFTLFIPVHTLTAPIRFTRANRRAVPAVLHMIDLWKRRDEGSAPTILSW